MAFAHMMIEYIASNLIAFEKLSKISHWCSSAKSLSCRDTA